MGNELEYFIFCAFWLLDWACLYPLGTSRDPPSSVGNWNQDHKAGSMPRCPNFRQWRQNPLTYRNPNPAPGCLNKIVKFEFRQLFAKGFAKKRCQLSFVMFPLFEAADQGKNLESSLWSWISTISAAAECFRTFKILDFNGVGNFCNLYIQPDIPQTVVKDLKSLQKYKKRLFA